MDSRVARENILVDRGLESLRKGRLGELEIQSKIAL